VGCPAPARWWRPLVGAGHPATGAAGATPAGPAPGRDALRGRR